MAMVVKIVDVEASDLHAETSSLSQFPSMTEVVRRLVVGAKDPDAAGYGGSSSSRSRNRSARRQSPMTF